MGTAALRPNLGGRPKINDHLTLYIYVRLGLRRTGLTVRQFMKLPSTSFEGMLMKRDAQPLRVALKGEALRRRYNKCRAALGLVEYRRGVIEAESPNKFVAYNIKTIERMIEELSD